MSLFRCMLLELLHVSVSNQQWRLIEVPPYFCVDGPTSTKSLHRQRAHTIKSSSSARCVPQCPTDAPGAIAWHNSSRRTMVFTRQW